MFLFLFFVSTCVGRWERDNTQLGKGLRLLWQYKQEIPWMALSTGFVMIEGAICAFPQHYQAMLISVITESLLNRSDRSSSGVVVVQPRRKLINSTLSRGGAVVDVLASLLVSHCLTTLISLLAEKISSMTNRRIGLKMQVDVYHSILQQDIEYWDVHDTDEAFDTLWASNDCVDDIMRFPNDILQTLSNITSTSYILYTKNKRLLGIMLILSPAQMIVQHYLGGLDYYISRRAWRKNINSRSDWGEVLDGKKFRTVRSFVREPREVKMFEQELTQETETKATTSAVRSLFQPVQSIVAQFSELMGLYYGGSMVIAGTLRAGDLISFISTSQNLSYTLRQLMYIKDEFSQSLEPAARVYDLLSHKPKIGLYGGLKPNESLVTGRLTFKNVCFTYPSRPDAKVLRGATFEVEGGTMCALVGPSGSGKSTILSLVERFYDPSEGTILLDGVDIKELDPCWLRSQMAIVSQEPVLFSVSIRENLIYGCEEEPSQATIEQACKDANIYDFIVKKCPNKWRTDVGEGGSEISVGQKQRIAIARALLKNPKILLLDEATSALDSESEVLVQKALEKLMQNRTTLVVAHRLSTIRGADRIVAIKNGTVAEQGDHLELLGKRGLYYSYVAKQRLLRHGTMEEMLENEEVRERREKENISDGSGKDSEAESVEGEVNTSVRNYSKSRSKLQAFPDMSPVFEGDIGSPAFPAGDVGRTEMEDMLLGTSAVSSEQSVSTPLPTITTTIFGLVPYDAAGDSPPRSPTRDKENVLNIHARSAPTTPNYGRKKEEVQHTMHRGRRHKGNKDKTHGSTNGSTARFYRAMSKLQTKMKGATSASDLRSLVEDFGHVCQVYAPKRKNRAEEHNMKRPHNSKRPISRTPQRRHQRETGDVSSGYEIEEEWSDSELIATIPLRRTRSYDDR
mgnify:CR=1 FL=1|jgi:ABC-type multidrug transport system fused ATPase/permease subunit